METVKFLVDGLVFVVGLLSWVIYIPQIRLMRKAKRSDSLSIGTVWGALVIQALLLTQQLIRHNWPAAIAAAVMFSCVTVVLILAYRYRRWPGGKP